MSHYKLEELFPADIDARLRENPVLVLPFGTIEWHSHHLPLGLDGLVAAALGERIADAAEAVLAPVSYWAVGGVPYPYTLKLPTDIIEPLLVTAFEQFAEMGFRVIVGFTGHFGLDQTLALKRAALTVMRRSPVTILPATEYDMTTDIGYKGDHAAVGETSLLWALRPELVKLDAIPAEEALDGVLGPDPRGAASQAEGERLLQDISNRTAEVARRLLNDTSAVQRQDYVEALAAGVRVLAATAKGRAEQPKAAVPSIGTPQWMAYCQAMYRGAYRDAKQAAEAKLLDLSQ